MSPAVLAGVLSMLIVLGNAVVVQGGVSGPDPALFLKLYDSETGRRYVTLYVVGVSDALQLSNQIECRHEKGSGPSTEAMTARVADVLRGANPPAAVAIAVIRVMRDSGCTRPPQ